MTKKADFLKRYPVIKEILPKEIPNVFSGRVREWGSSWFNLFLQEFLEFFFRNSLIVSRNSSSFFLAILLKKPGAEDSV